MTTHAQAAWHTPPRHLVLTGDEVHVWRVELNVPEVREAALWRLLSEDEQKRAARFHFEQHRRRFVAARGLLRVTLARYLDSAPKTIQFRYGPQGKPALDNGQSVSGLLRFNIAHSADLALFAVAAGRAVGVDLERRRSLPDTMQLARRFFSPDEVAVVEAAEGDDRQARFFQIWSRKEAYIKAIGKGLSQALADFDVVDRTGAPTPFVRLRADNVGPHWRIVDLSPHPDFAAAVVAEGEGWELKRLEIGD